ncbi:MAG: hypothetical protein ABI480_16405 [Chitinophagaceae bacterium]
MIRRSLKYLLIAFANTAILTLMLALWTDELELKLNRGVRFFEFLKIIGFTIAVLIGMRMLVSYFKNINATRFRYKMRITILVTLLVSSYLYISYSYKVIKNVVVESNFRKQIADKIKTDDQLNKGAGDSLSLKEYKETIKITKLPALPESATNISYEYYSEGFLPDYSLTLIYDMPLSATIESIDYKKGKFSKYQQWEIVGDKKRVTYSEGIM